jgi:hypothetical protein
MPLKKGQVAQILTEATDQYRNHYQAFEVGMFGAVANVAAAILLVSVFKGLFLEAHRANLPTRLWQFSWLYIGYVGLLTLLASAFDQRIPRAARYVIHGFLFVGLAVYAINATQTIAYVSSSSQLRTDHLLYLSVFVITIVSWVFVHAFFRYFGRPHRWRTLVTEK